MQFCKLFQHKYCDISCTPNMHLHAHICQCLLHYEPVHGFWCFPFERFNGKLGVYHTNNNTNNEKIYHQPTYQNDIYSRRTYGIAKFASRKKGLHSWYNISAWNNGRTSDIFRPKLHIVWPYLELVGQNVQPFFLSYTTNNNNNNDVQYKCAYLKKRCEVWPYCIIAIYPV